MEFRNRLSCLGLIAEAGSPEQQLDAIIGDPSIFQCAENAEQNMKKLQQASDVLNQLYEGLRRQFGFRIRVKLARDWYPDGRVIESFVYDPNDGKHVSANYSAIRERFIRLFNREDRGKMRLDGRDVSFSAEIDLTLGSCPDESAFLNQREAEFSALLFYRAFEELYNLSEVIRLSRLSSYQRNFELLYNLSEVIRYSKRTRASGAAQEREVARDQQQAERAKQLPRFDWSDET